MKHNLIEYSWFKATTIVNLFIEIEIKNFV